MQKTFTVLSALAFFSLGARAAHKVRLPHSHSRNAALAASHPRAFLGFDRNIYPGDDALSALRRTFSFCGFWLNIPPGVTSDSFRGKRRVLLAHGFGFLVLFNGRLDAELNAAPGPKILGARDAAAAAESARREGFPRGTIIFLDQEEGGRMLPEQRAYLRAWFDGVAAAGYRAGVYCSGMPAPEEDGGRIITASDIRNHAGGRKIVFWVYNDQCPPSPGCTFPRIAQAPRRSGVPFASVWQFAQSPRRLDETRACPSHYDRDGNCYAPLPSSLPPLYIDLDWATSPDPSSAR